MSTIRYVHSQRARKLRRRGEHVRFVRWWAGVPAACVGIGLAAAIAQFVADHGP
jgi:hypothetical protein